MYHKVEIRGYDENEHEFNTSHLYVRTREDYENLRAELDNVLATYFYEMYPYAPLIKNESKPLYLHALLERIANEFISDERGCCYCHATLEYPQPIVQHKDDCPIAQVRKFLKLEK